MVSGSFDLQRRRLLACLGALPVTPPLHAQPQPAPPDAALRTGAVAVLLRHAATTPGVGDPPGFRAGDCATQRNLSDDGRAQARRIGAWFERHGLQPAAVRSSAWCRCVDTARLAFGRSVHWPVLDSTFGARDEQATWRRLRQQALDAALRALPAGRFEVWVTHQVNITAATGEFVGMGEGVLVRAGAAAGSPPVVLARLAFDA